MAMLAVSLQPSSPPGIFARSHQLHMRWVHTVLDLAKVVDLEAIGDSSIPSDIGVPVGGDHCYRSCGETELAVAISVHSAKPQPTSLSETDLRPEPFFCGMARLVARIRPVVRHYPYGTRSRGEYARLAR